MKFFHPRCVGCDIEINGVPEKISRVLKNAESFRIKSEENTPKIKDYGFDDLTKATDLLMSDDKKTWIKFSFMQTKL